MELKVDKKRWKEKKAWEGAGGTGIFVRALTPEGWSSADIIMLDKNSLLKWLKNGGGDNPYAEDVVGIILGHGHLHA